MSAANQLSNIGLIDLSAVATLVGAPSAEALVLGLKGACGVAWAPVSAFGALNISKASLAAAVPDWAREPLGLRSPAVDDAVGRSARVDVRRRARDRVDTGNVLAVRLVFRERARRILPLLPATASEEEVLGTVVESHYRWPPESVYTLDRNAQSVLHTVEPSGANSPLAVNEYVPDIAGQHKAWKDWAVLLASLAKLSETVTLWHLGSTTLWWASSMSWVAGFFCAIVLQLSGLGRDSTSRSKYDIISGALPSPLVLGGAGKLVLGVPANVRRHIFWTIAWTLMAVINLGSIIVVFVSLHSQSNTVLYTWIAFQVVWLLARTAVYGTVVGASAQQGVFKAQAWSTAPLAARRRGIRMLMALSKQQVMVHPRGVRAYALDLHSGREIASMLDAARWHITDVLVLPSRAMAESKYANASLERAEVLAVVGDTVLRSIIWSQFSRVDNSEIYDAALVFLRLGGVVYAVPAARVYACDCNRDSRLQHRGNSHAESCRRIEWVMWIPCVDDGVKGWWYVHGLETKGEEMTAERMSEDELDSKLSVAHWNISLQAVEEVKAVVDVSRTAAKLLTTVLESVQDDGSDKISGA